MRKAFTLIELLVVIFVIAMLMGLIFPAFQVTREAARRIQCTSQQKNLATGFIHYEEARGNLPGWREFITVLPPQEAPPDWSDQEIAAHASWVFSLLPYIEQTDLFNQLKAGLVPAGPPTDPSTMPIPSLALLRCPSHLEGPQSRATNYVVNGGAVDDFSNSDDPVTTDGNIANGPFLDRCRIVAGPPYAPPECGCGTCRYDANVRKYQKAVARLSDISGMDGTSYTLLTSENVQRGYWISEDIVHFYNDRKGNSLKNIEEIDNTSDWISLPDGRYTIKLTSFGNSTLTGDTIEGSVAFCWPRDYVAQDAILLHNVAYPRNDDEAFTTPGNAKQGFTDKRYDPSSQIIDVGRNVYDATMIPVWLNTLPLVDFSDSSILQDSIGKFEVAHSWYPSARPSSLHGEIVIVSFCDGNVRRLNRNMSEIVFVQMMTCSDVQSDAGWRFPTGTGVQNFLEGRMLNTGEAFRY